MNSTETTKQRTTGETSLTHEQNVTLTTGKTLDVTTSAEIVTISTESINNGTLAVISIDQTVVKEPPSAKNTTRGVSSKKHENNRTNQGTEDNSFNSVEFSSSKPTQTSISSQATQEPTIQYIKTFSTKVNKATVADEPTTVSDVSSNATTELVTNFTETSTSSSPQTDKIDANSTELTSSTSFNFTENFPTELTEDLANISTIKYESTSLKTNQTNFKETKSTTEIYETITNKLTLPLELSTIATNNYKNPSDTSTVLSDISTITSDTSTIQTTNISNADSYFNKHKTEVISGSAILILFVLIGLFFSLRYTRNCPCSRKRKKKKIENKTEDIDDRLNYRPSVSEDIEMQAMEYGKTMW